MSEDMQPRVTHCPQCGRAFGDPGMRCDLVRGCMDNAKPQVQLPRPWEVAGTTEPILPDDHPLMQEMGRVMRKKPLPPHEEPLLKWADIENRTALPTFADIDAFHPPRRPEEIADVDFKIYKHNQYCRDDWQMYHGAGPRGMGPNGDGCVCSLDPVPSYRMDMPRLWPVTPIAVTHIAGACLVLFDRYMRQRCDWCGVTLLEYDLRRVMVPVGQEGLPGSWTPGTLVRVDSTVQADILEPTEMDGKIQLPPDCCAFDPKTQIA